MFLREILQHPLTKNMSIDDPKTTELRKTNIEFMNTFANFSIIKYERRILIFYIISAGVSVHSFVRGSLYRAARFVERLVTSDFASMFALIVLEKRHAIG